MKRQHLLAAAGGVALVIAGYINWDVLTVTDEEVLEGFVEEVTGPVTPGRIRGAIDRWVDLETQPLEVSALGQPLFFSEGEQDALSDRATRLERELRGATLRALSSAIRIDGDQATIALRLLSRARGMGQVEWRLRRHGSRWLVERLAVTR